MRFLLSKLRIFLFFPIPYLSQPLFLGDLMTAHRFLPGAEIPPGDQQSDALVIFRIQPPFHFGALNAGIV